MIARPTRVALFPDSLNEVNGVANTCRNFVAYTQRRQMPMLVVSAGPETVVREDGTLTHLTLRRGPVSFPLEKDLRFDLGILRHYRRVTAALRDFNPDVVHITGPSDIGIIGALAAHDLGIPVAASWHTNVHEYAARRSEPLLPRWMGHERRIRLLQFIEDASFKLSALYFQLGRFHFAPNQELMSKLSAATHKPCALMERGVDLSGFHPSHRDRTDDGQFVIGYVGRLSTEKRVRCFAQLSEACRAAGHNNVRFVFVGHGNEQPWLREHVAGAEFTGVLRGPSLSRAYANMDLFAFFSETDTFGNVVLEALASGVPAVVTDKGGPKFIVGQNTGSACCGYVCADDAEFTASVLRLIENPTLRGELAKAARQRAERASWDAVFDLVYETYARELPQSGRIARPSRFRRVLTALRPRVPFRRPL